MSNVIYGFQVVSEEEPQKALIDSNGFSDELIAAEERAYRARLQEEENRQRLEALIESGGEVPEGMDPAEFLGLADTIMEEAPVEEPSVDYIAMAQEEAERLLEAARAQANDITENARINGDAQRALAREDGFKEGYNEGIQKAALELKEKEDQLQIQLQTIRQEFMEKELTMEHDIVDMCCKVFSKVFGAELEGCKPVLIHLLDNCVMNIDPSHQMQIKVCEENADLIREHKAEIQKKIGSDITIDVIVDPVLSESQCYIETDGGLFDCSIDTELDTLIRKIKSLG